MYGKVNQEHRSDNTILEGGGIGSSENEQTVNQTPSQINIVCGRGAGPGWEMRFVQLRSNEGKGCRGDWYGTRHTESAVDKKAEREREKER